MAKIVSTLLDNSSEELSMVNALNKCIQDEDVRTIRIATGYWDLYACRLVADSLREFFKRDGAHMYLLLGKDPYIYQKQLSEADASTRAAYPKDYIKRDLNAIKDKMDSTFRAVLDEWIQYISDHKLEVKLYTRKKEVNSDYENPEHIGDSDDVDLKIKDEILHAKCYIFNNDSDEDNHTAYGIIGSSNFTGSGLSKDGKSELNFLTTDHYLVYASAEKDRLCRGHISWFNEKWKIGIDWDQRFLEEVLKPFKKVVDTLPLPPESEPETPKEIKPLSPYELYIKALQNEYDSIVDTSTDADISSYLPKGAKALKYQIDAVKQCLQTMEAHGGFMLADVVGLGKTYVGTMVAKYFLTHATERSVNKEVLVIAPPAIMDGWKEAITEFDADSDFKIADHIQVLSTGKVSDDDNELEDGMDENLVTNELSVLAPKYGLILVDESHKFRNNKTHMYKALEKLINDCWVEQTEYPYVGLISATPQNNRPTDLKNQIALFERDMDHSTLTKANKGDLEGYFASLNKKLVELRKDEDISEKEKQSRLIDIYTQMRLDILEDILIRRTRTDIVEHYGEDMKLRGLTFPKVHEPEELRYELKGEVGRLFYRSMDMISPDLSLDINRGSTQCLGYYRYRAIEFLKDPATKNLYKGGNLDVDRYSLQLAQIMQLQLVKRLESSLTAFTSSLKNLRNYTKIMEEMWKHNRIYVCPQLDINHVFAPVIDNPNAFDACVATIDKKIAGLKKKEDKERNTWYHQKDFDEKYFALLESDMKLLENLYVDWSKYSEVNDPKLDKFKQYVKTTFFSTDKTKAGVAPRVVIFTESVDTANAVTRALTETGHTPLLITAENRTKDKIKIRENFDANYEVESHEYDCIVTTEVLSEGVNLHRANVILNYDTPWNSTKLMQRIGRVNRIGSDEDNIYIYNFLPSDAGNYEINLLETAHRKLQSFHTLFGEDSKVYTNDEELVKHSWKDFVEGPASPKETLIHELRNYKEANPMRYQEILGIEDNLCMSVEGKDGQSLFVLKAGKHQVMYEAYDRSTMVATPLGRLDFFAAMKCAESSIRLDLPTDWEDIADEVQFQTNEQLSAALSKNKLASQAQSAIKVIKDTLKRNSKDYEHELEVLDEAFQRIFDGDSGVMRLVIAYAKSHTDNEIFVPTIEDLEKKLISKVESTAQKDRTVAKIYLAMVK